MKSVVRLYMVISTHKHVPTNQDSKHHKTKRHLTLMSGCLRKRPARAMCTMATEVSYTQPGVRVCVLLCDHHRLMCVSMAC
jgi:hypothetical protein